MSHNMTNKENMLMETVTMIEKIEKAVGKKKGEGVRKEEKKEKKEKRRKKRGEGKEKKK